MALPRIPDHRPPPATPSAPIAAVCFDLDDTLLDHSRAERLAALAFQERWRGDLPAYDDFAAAWKQATAAAFEVYLAGRVAFRGQRRLRIRSLFRDEAIPDDECDRRFAVYLDGYRAHWRLCADALPALDALGHLPLAIITNAPAEQQQAKLERTGIAGRFRALCTPETAGAGKPAAAIFHQACERLGVRPERCLHVGDHREHDAIGACAAGLRGVWIDRAGVGDRADPGGHAGERITSLAGLPSLVTGAHRPEAGR